MKIKKTKLQRKHLQFYAVNFGLRAPYKVLPEPEFMQKAMDNKVFLREDLPKLLHDTAYLVVTSCIVHDLGVKGESFSGSAIMAKRLFREKCTHTEAVSSQQCIKDTITSGFSGVIGAQTEEFIKELRNIPGVPIVTVSERNHNLVLEAPSKASQFQADKMSHFKALKISPEEAAMIEEARKELGQEPIPPPQPSKKRKRLPLKKKKKSQNENEQSNANENNNNNNEEAKKRTRRKKKKSDNINVQESSSNISIPSDH